MPVWKGEALDAKITKQRLGNLLSYDWLKILLVIAAAITALTVFFTMVRTRPTEEQTFTVFGYCVREGAHHEDEPDADRFSYEILATASETFDAKTSYLFSVRRSTGQGTVMFISDITQPDEEGNVVQQSDLMALTDGVSGGIALDTKEYMTECRAYLTRFFGEELKEENLNAELVRETFLSRNGKDKRFRTNAKKEAGILQEEERLKKLRNDYLTVVSAIEDGKLVHKEKTTDDKTYSVAFGMGELNKISKLYYCGAYEDKQDALCLVLLNNRNPDSDLRYEAVSYLSYLVQTFGE